MNSNSLIIKVCGMRHAENIRDVESLDVDWMGFIFYPPSKRYVGKHLTYLPQRSKRVGVFVNESLEAVLEQIEVYGLNIVQLHGDETPKFCNELRQQGIQVMKAFGIANHLPAEKIIEYEGACNYFLFDTQTSNYGGSGRKYDWDILQEYKGNTPFLLSGGIGADDVEALKAYSNPKCIGIDINSKFEHSAADKDVQSIHHFIKTLKQ